MYIPYKKSETWIKSEIVKFYGPWVRPLVWQYHVHEVFIIFSHFESGNILKHFKQHIKFILIPCFINIEQKCWTIEPSLHTRRSRGLNQQPFVRRANHQFCTIATCAYNTSISSWILLINSFFTVLSFSWPVLQWWYRLHLSNVWAENSNLHSFRNIMIIKCGTVYILHV